MKKCAICKRSFPAAKFCYGGKQSNSYCQPCSEKFTEEYIRRQKAGQSTKGIADYLRGQLLR